MKFKLLLLAALASTLFFTACEEDNSEKIEKSYDLSGFTEINLGDAFRINISKGTTYEVSARGTVRDIDDLQLKVVNGKLSGQYNNNHNNRKRTEITIQLPELTYLRLSGATDTNLSGFTNQNEDLKLVIDGASALDADMELNDLDLNISGASEVTLNGAAQDVQANISGASRLFGSSFRMETMDANVSGVSKASVNVVQSLKGSVSGNSEIRYKGNPTTVQVEVSGGSTLGKL